ncbi:MAG: hypothetical protein R2779_06015 [Crocinitomicaceae bacterium]
MVHSVLGRHLKQPYSDKVTSGYPTITKEKIWMNWCSFVRQI